MKAIKHFLKVDNNEVWKVAQTTGKVNVKLTVFFFYLGFLSRTLMNHRTAGEGGGHLFNSLLPLPPASQALGH